MIKKLISLSVLSISLATMLQAREITATGNAFQRAGMLACPEGAIASGVSSSGNLLLCQTGYSGLLGAEILDGSPPTQWPKTQSGVIPQAAVGGAHRYFGPTMHACPRNQIVTGVHKGRNTFLCSTLMHRGESQKLGRYEVVSGTTRSNAMACPSGMALAGIHFGNQTLLCVEARFCSENAHCSQGQQCSAKNESLSGDARFCVPSGVVRLNKSDDCVGDTVRFLETYAGNTISDLRGDGDDARSALLLGVKSGAILEFWDASGFNANDDRAFVTARTGIRSACITNLDLPPDGMINTPALFGIKPTTGNLAGKVSSVRFFSEIRDTLGRCVILASDNVTNFGSQLLTVGLCNPAADANGVPPARWFRETDGTIRLHRSRPNLCLSAVDTRFRTEFSESVPDGVLTLRLCESDNDSFRWTATPEGQLKAYSNLCLTTAEGLTGPQNPTLKECVLPVPDNQRWFTNL